MLYLPLKLNSERLDFGIENSAKVFETYINHKEATLKKQLLLCRYMSKIIINYTPANFLFQFDRHPYCRKRG